jgi:ribosomal protein S18 acetylase RimI-like enzyme
VFDAMCVCRFLRTEEFAQLYDAFMVAFGDYYVDSSYLTREALYNRAIKNGIVFDASVGAFDGGVLVGFTMVGLDEWKGCKAAFDIATGVVPTHRGRGLARRMFDTAVPRLKEWSVERFVLEVLQGNGPAVKAYKSAGFEVTREFDCFSLDRRRARLTPRTPVDVRLVDRRFLCEVEAYLDWHPSWENSFSSITRIPDAVTLHGAFDGNRCVGLLVYYPVLNWIQTLVVDPSRRRRGIATALIGELLEHLSPEVTTIKLNNVDHSDSATLALLSRTGFELVVSQYEMEMVL